MAFTPQTLIYGLIFCSCFLAVQTFIGVGKQASIRIKLANDRLRRMKSESSQAVVLSKMKRSRGLNEDDQLQVFINWIGRLVLQSGLPLGSKGFYFVMAGVGLSCALTLGLMKGTFLWAIIGLFIGIFAPIFILKYLVNRRTKKAITQLPEALDVIVRSLRAGHPVPVALALVAREMPDPIGSEFGMASDEIAFGSTTPAAVQRLADRVGHEDFELFSAVVRLQERTGGNLAELLASISKTIRDRQRMRLKIKAASAEGRMSAMILNAAPLLLFLGINKMAPDFYGEVDGNPLMIYALWGVVIWMGIGNLIMHKMIKFKF